MEQLDEFDEPISQDSSFCHQITKETYEKQRTENTKEELESLTQKMDDDKCRKTLYSVIRKKKIDNLKGLDRLRVTIASAFKKNYHEKLFPDEECQKEVETLKHQMTRVFEYAQGL